MTPNEPPLHVKLDFVKNVLKAMDKNGEGFRFLKRKFPELRDAEIKEGVFENHKSDN